MAEQQKTAGDLPASVPGSTQAPLAWGDSKMRWGSRIKFTHQWGWGRISPGWEHSIMAYRTWDWTG